MRRHVGTLAALALATMTAPAAAQMVDIPIWSNGILGQQALRNTYDNYNRANGLDGNRKKATPQRACSADSLPAAERRRMEVQYGRLARSQGKAAADIWVREQGMAFHRRLVAEGVCAAPGARDQTPREARAESTPRNDGTRKDGKGCRMVTRPIANVGGGGMTMGLVPDCD